MRITLLCKVVDNYGDIGFVYRLSRNLAERNPALEITLVVSNLESFSAMAPGIKNVPVQKFRGWDILDWNAKKYYSSERFLRFTAFLDTLDVNLAIMGHDAALTGQQFRERCARWNRAAELSRGITDENTMTE